MNHARIWRDESFKSTLKAKFDANLSEGVKIALQYQSEHDIGGKAFKLIEINDQYRHIIDSFNLQKDYEFVKSLITQVFPQQEESK